MTLLRRSFTPPSGPDLHSVGNFRFEVVLPGRNGDWLNFKYSARNLPGIQLPQKPRRPPLPDSVARGGVAPNVQKFNAPVGDNKARIRPKSACLPSRGRDCHTNFVPQPPPKAWGDVVRPSRPCSAPSGRNGAHERLRGDSARGVATRAAVRRAIAGDDVGKSRWSDLKVLYTQLVDAINGDCIPSLLSSIAQVEAAGMIDWPEYASALARLRSLQELMAQLESASVSADISEVRRALDAAMLLRAGPAGLASGTTWALQDALQCRLEKFRETEDELKCVANGSSIPALVQALRCAHDLGINSCPQAQLAEIRLKVLNAAHQNLCDALASENVDNLLAAEAAAVDLGVSEQSDLPLGSLLSVVRQRLRKREQDCQRNTSEQDCQRNISEQDFQRNTSEQDIISQPDWKSAAEERFESSDAGTEVESMSQCSSKYVADFRKEVDTAIERMVDAEVHSDPQKSRRLDEKSDDSNSVVESTSHCSSKYVADVCKEVDTAIERVVDVEVHSDLRKSRRLDDKSDDSNSPSPSEIMQKEARALLTNVMLEDLASGAFDDVDLEHFQTEGDANADSDKRHTPDLYQQSTRYPSTTPGLGESMFNQSGKNFACRPNSSQSSRVESPPIPANSQVEDVHLIGQSMAMCGDSEEASAIRPQGCCGGNDSRNRNQARDELFLLVCDAVRSIADTLQSDTSSETSFPSSVQTCDDSKQI